VEKKEENPEPLAESAPVVKGEVETDPDAIIKAWNDYAASLEKSMPRIFSTLTSNRPVVAADGAIQLLLNSEAQRDNFNKNIRSGLLESIRERTGNPYIEIVTEVSENEQRNKKIYTEQDKLEFLMKRNPELVNMKSRFKLDFDD
jgi:DNA polymerase-3 subunit gamma/tau